MAFKYTPVTNTKISDIFNGLKPKTTTPITLPPSAVPFAPVTRSLPNNGGTYQSPVVAQPVAPPVVKPAPVVPPPPQPGPASLDYSKYTDPVTGRVLSPAEYADMMAKRVVGGSIPNYAGNALTGGPQTTAELTSTATDLNNERNDIATGTKDPYASASKSGISYSPTDLQAIEKAYAGIYDPALKDVFAKLDAKQKEDAAATDLKTQLTVQAQKHKDDLELKRTPTASESNAASLSASGAGPYVAGANPTVDAWAQRIFDGNAKITDIPASDKGLRSAVTIALTANGNKANGRPTTSALGLQALQTAQDLMNKIAAGQGTSAIGTSRIFGGAILGGTPGTDASNLSNDFNTLKSQLSLDAVKYLKGQGAVSDAERALLSAAVTKLNLAQSDSEFKTTLQGIINTLQDGSDDSSGSTNVVTAPDGTSVEITD